MKTYKTSEIAFLIGIHPNTVRLYEDLELIPKPKRQANNYRIFTDFHLEQIRLIRLAFQIEVLQNGLRKTMIRVIKLSALSQFDEAIKLANIYLNQVQKEKQNAEEAIHIVERILTQKETNNQLILKRKEVSEYLNISMDSLRNWEMNGLLTIKRKQNGYRIYTNQDIDRLKIIKALKCANYSLEAILRMLSQLSLNPQIDIRLALNTPSEDTDIIAVCDTLINSLIKAEENANQIIDKLNDMKSQF